MRFQRPELFALLSVLASAACGGGTGPAPETKGGTSLPRFGSEEELVGYLEKHDTTTATGTSSDAGAGGSSSSGSSGSSGAGASSSDNGGSASSPAPSNNETITNNQEAGVDEGGIVKNIDGALVILRKGRLYAVSVAAAGAPAQTDSIAVAPSAALNSNVWYDEMLVRGDQIYVIGYRYGLKLASEQSSPYSYGHGATEVSSFRLAGGKLERQKTLFLESNDYFSGTNYASRMIDGKLVFYMPHQAWRNAPQGPSSSSGSSGSTTPKKSLQIPTYFTASPDGTFTKGAPIFAPTDVYVPIDAPKNPVFHTVVKCDLPEGGDITCTSRSLLSNWGREHYVTPKAVFLWSLPRAYMFRFDDLGVVAHKAAATPTDQFSFKENDGKLHILGNEWFDPDAKKAEGTSTGGSGEATVQKRLGLVLESLPIADFDLEGEQSLAGKERVVEAGGETSAQSQSVSYVTKNRFVGDAVFAGFVKYDYGSSGATAPKGRLVRVELGSGAVSSRELAGVVTRIEPMGDGRALVAIQEQTALSLESVPVTGELGAQGNTRIDGLTEGESRSHGFFFKPSANGAGAFGLPIMNAQNPGGGGSYYGGGISNIGFWSVAESGALATLGVVSSSKEAGVCETSCVDWYGNTRPIFIGDRAFALMGSELSEISLSPASRLGAPAVLTK